MDDFKGELSFAPPPVDLAAPPGRKWAAVKPATFCAVGRLWMFLAGAATVLNWRRELETGPARQRCR